MESCVGAAEVPPSRYASGLTKRTLMLLAMLLLLLVSSNVYIALAGGVLGMLSNYALVVLFTYVSRYLGADLTKQEVYTLFYALTFSWVFFNSYSVVYRAYLRVSEITNAFLIEGRPVAQLLPSWLAPPTDSLAFKLRTLFHPDMVLPLCISLMFAALWLVAELSMVMIAGYLFVEVEALPYPLAQVDAVFITMVSERPAEWLRAFLPTMGLLLFLSTLLYVPSVGIVVGLPVPPIGFYDFTPQITDLLPGGVLGINFSPWTVATGFMMPLAVATAALVTSLLVWMIFNSLFVTDPFFRSMFPDWAVEYRRGMPYSQIVERSTLRVWAPIQLGSQMALSLLLVVRYRREIARALSALSKASSVSLRGYPPLRTLLAMFFASSGLATLLYWLLLPEMPIYAVATMVIGLGMLIPLVNAYMAGKAGPGLGIPPYTWHSVVYSMMGRASPSTQVTAILFGPPMVGGMAAGGTQAVKVASIVGAEPKDFIKAVALAFIIGTAVNVLIVDALWRLAPIPSMAYPSSMGMRDSAAYDCVVASGVLPLKPSVILLATGLFLLIYAALESLNVTLHLPLSIAGVAMGLITTPALTIVYFISSLTVNYITPKFIGREGAVKWGSMKGVLVSGAVLGDGLAATLFTLVGLIGRASWTWPW